MRQTSCAQISQCKHNNNKLWLLPSADCTCSILCSGNSHVYMYTEDHLGVIAGSSWLTLKTTNQHVSVMTYGVNVVDLVAIYRKIQNLKQHIKKLH